MEIKMHAWIHFEVRLLAQGVYMKIPMGPPPHEVSAWSMSFPEGMAMEIPVGILIPMQIRNMGIQFPRRCGGAAWGAGLPRVRGQPWHLRTHAGIHRACSRSP